MSQNRILLYCGILSSLYYIGMNIFIPPLFEGYSSVSQTISELSAIGAPTRLLWVTLAFIYVLLVGAFSLGVKALAQDNHYLQKAAIFLIIYVMINFYWPPMHLRGNDPTLTDTLHIAWAVTTICLMMLIMGFGAAALSREFQIYTMVTFVVFIVFGILIAIESPNILKNLPTPTIGLWERINIGAFMLWQIFFAIALLRKTKLTYAV